MALALEVWPEQREEQNSCEVKVPEEKRGLWGCKYERSGVFVGMRKKGTGKNEGYVVRRGHGKRYLGASEYKSIQKLKRHHFVKYTIE